MSKDTITRGEYHALIKVWNNSPCTQPKGVQINTLWNLEHKRLIESQKRKNGHTYYWLTDAGKAAMDEYPHLERLARAKAQMA